MIKESNNIISNDIKMSFFNKIYDIIYTDMFKYIFHSRSDKILDVNVTKITTFNKNVVDSEWALASHTFRLVVTG